MRVSTHLSDQNIKTQVVCIPACTGQEGSVCQGVSAQGGVCPGQCLPRRGVYPESVCLGVSAWGVSTQLVSARRVSARHPLVPCEQNDLQTGVKTLPCCNYIADGNNNEKQSFGEKVITEQLLGKTTKQNA